MRRTFFSHFIATVIVVASASLARADGQLDPTFFHTNIESAGLVLVQQPDGRLVAAGGGAVVRILPDGGKDPLFSNAVCNSTVQSLALHGSGKIVIGGDFFTVNGVSRNRKLARLNPDGSLDDSFAPQLHGFDLGVYSLLVDDDGGVIAGRINGGGSALSGVPVRWDTNGAPDTNFVAPAINGSVLAMARQPDGKILIGGEFTSIGGLTRNRLARLNADGSHDTNFMAGLSGFVNTLSLAQVRAILPLAGGDILAAGRFNVVNGAPRIHVARLDHTGALNTSFTGFTARVFGTLVRALNVQDDGKVFVGGNFTNIDGQTRRGFARLNPDGSLDDTFGEGLNGASLGEIGDATVTALTLVGTNKLLVSGGFSEINGVPRRGIARVWTVPPPAMPPQVLVQPVGTNVFQGTPVSLSIEAVGTTPLAFHWRKDGQPISGATAKAFSITNTVPADSGAYSILVTNAFGTNLNAEAMIIVAPTVPLAEALDAPQLSWMTSGDATWRGQTNVTHDGTDAAHSSETGDDEFSDLQTSVTGPGVLTFWWKVSSEEDFDFLQFFINGVKQPGELSGEVDWQQRTFAVPAGAQTLRWHYEKDGSVDEGQDAGWVDEVVFIPDVGPQLLSPAIAGTNFTFAFQSASGASYTIESNTNLATSHWFFLQTIPGDGSLRLIQVPLTNGPQRFFRLRQP